MEIRYSDVDFKDELSASALLAFAQDAAGTSADELGFGYGDLKPLGYGFLIVNTYCDLPEAFVNAMTFWSKKGMVLTLFLIGASLSLKSIREVGIKPLLLAILLWILIGVSSFFVVEATIV